MAEGIKSKVASSNAKVQWSQAYSDEVLCVFLPEILHFHRMRFCDSGEIRFELQRFAKSDDILVLTGSLDLWDNFRSCILHDAIV